MPWSGSTIYKVEHKDGWLVPELRVSNAVMSHAQAGETNYRSKVAIAFKERLLKDNNGNGPQWVDYDHLKFTKLRDVPAAKKASAKKAAPSGRAVRGTTLQMGAANYDDVGEGGCGCDCAACDLGLRHCGNRGRGCKAA